MAASVNCWHSLRFDLFNVNPPLTRLWCGLPVVLCNPSCDWGLFFAPKRSLRMGVSPRFHAANRPEKTVVVFCLARWSLIPLLLLGGYCGYRLSCEMYGHSAALLFLVLWCFSPMLLAWGATICPDAVAAALGLVAIYTFRRWLYKP